MYSWSIACLSCSNYIFILNLTPGFSGLDKDNCKTTWEAFKSRDLLHLIYLRFDSMSKFELWMLHISPWMCHGCLVDGWGGWVLVFILYWNCSTFHQATLNSLRQSDAYSINKLTIIGSDNGLPPGWRQAIIWANAGILLIWTPKTKFNEFLIEIHTFSSKKIFGWVELIVI